MTAEAAMEPFKPGDVVPVTGPYQLVWGIDFFPQGKVFLYMGRTFPEYPDCLYVPLWSDLMTQQTGE